MRQWFLVGCGMAALVSTQMAHAQSADAPAAPIAPTESDPDDIVVTGYRESIEAARETKREADAVVDAIVAEDIAAFPQANLSEAIQRISGVQIRRDFAGAVGNEISIRGLGPEYTQVSVNGQAAPTDGEDRTFNFNILPADLFRRVEVYKSPTAELEEGGVGGTVSLETIKPLDMKDRLFSVAAGGNYNGITDKLDPRGSIALGGKLAPNLGVVGAVSFDKFAAASQSYDAVRWTRRDFDVDGDKKKDYTDVFLMDLPRLMHEEQNVRRISASGRLEWRATDDFTILADGLYTHFRQRKDRLTPIWSFNAGKGIRDINVTDGVVDYISYDSVLLRSENQRELSESEMYRGGLEGQYRFDDWLLKAFVSKSRSNKNTEQFRYYGDNNAPAAYDTRGDEDYFTITTPTDLADPDAYTTTEARQYLIHTRDDDLTAGFNLAGDILPHLELKAGLKYRDRQRSRQRYYARITKINEPFNLISTRFSGFLDNEDRAANGPHAFAYSDFDKAYELYGSKIDIFDGAEVNNFFDVTEKSWAGFGMLSYRDGPLRANLGVRVVHTSITSHGVEINNTTDEENARTVKSSYIDALPSLNLRYEMAPKLFVRAAAARVMTRPSLSDLAVYRVVNDENLTISEKNPDLKPFRANQFDLSVEWYFGKAGLLSAGYFYKDIESFIVTESTLIPYDGETYELRRPVNGNSAKVQGFEVNYQQPFTFLPGFLGNFGVVANYTFTDSNFKDMVEGTTLTYELPENSKHSFNLVGYYEDEELSVRLAYNYRSKFLREKPNEQDGLKYRSGYGQADFAARYKLLPQLTLTLDVLNLFNAHTDEYVYERRLTDGYFTAGRTVQFGLRASF